MTKVYAAVILLALILAAGFAESKAVGNTADEMLALIVSADDAAQHESGELHELCLETNALWKSRKPTLELFLPHTELDETDIAADALVLYSGLNDYPNARASLFELKNRMESLKGSEDINLINLL